MLFGRRPQTRARKSELERQSARQRRETGGWMARQEGELTRKCERRVGLDDVVGDERAREGPATVRASASRRSPPRSLNHNNNPSLVARPHDAIERVDRSCCVASTLRSSSRTLGSERTRVVCRQGRDLKATKRETRALFCPAPPASISRSGRSSCSSPWVSVESLRFSRWLATGLNQRLLDIW